MRFLGQTMHGIYVDDCQGLHPDIIERYYGVEGTRIKQQVGQSGAGLLEDEGDLDDSDSEVGYVEGEDDIYTEAEVMDEDDWEDIQGQLAEDIEHNFHHSPVDVPKHSAPFRTQVAVDVFNGSLEELQAKQIIPAGFGITAVEWGNEGYPSYEVIRTGRRGRKELRIDLPDFVWRPRAELWVQALHILLSVKEMEDTGLTD
jgi:hypothetical protein